MLDINGIELYYIFISSNIYCFSLQVSLSCGDNECVEAVAASR